MGDEILSPPYPSAITTLPRLVQHLGDLRTWVVEHAYWCNSTVFGLGALVPLIPDEDEIPRVPSLERMHYLAIADIFECYQSMQKLREFWDDMVRSHGGSWDSRTAVQLRLRAFHVGFLILNGTFIDPETREARRERQVYTKRRAMKQVMRKLGVPEELLGPDAKFYLGAEGPVLNLDAKDSFMGRLSCDELEALFHASEGDPDENEDENGD